MQVRPELATGAGNCSIVSYRKLWADTASSPQVLLKAALAVNASGWNIDLEPQVTKLQHTHLRELSLYVSISPVISVSVSLCAGRTKHREAWLGLPGRLPAYRHRC